MKIISYTGTRPGFQAIGSWAVRKGTNSLFSHTELVFEPGDGVDHLMPDGTTEPDENGAVWCASASANDIMPEWSKRRAGHRGGVRFKRIVVDNKKWQWQALSPVFNPTSAALLLKSMEGLGYDWRHIAGFMGPVFNLIFSHSENKVTCSEICAIALGFAQAHRFHPGNLPPVLERFPLTASDEVVKG